MRINHKTLLFEDFTLAERAEMLTFARELVLEGKIPHPLPPWVKAWMSELGYDDRQELLLLSTAFPQRVLLSLLPEPLYHIEGSMEPGVPGAFASSLLDDDGNGVAFDGPDSPTPQPGKFRVLVEQVS